MAEIIYKDRVKENCQFAGIGDVTLLGTLPGFTGFPDGDTTYALDDPINDLWEVGEGVVAGGVLTRTTVYANHLGTVAHIDFGVATGTAIQPVTSYRMNILDTGKEDADPALQAHLIDVVPHRIIDDSAPSTTSLYSSNKIELLNSGSLVYKGVWDAVTNIPALADGVGTEGWFYVCNVAGGVDFGSGIINFLVGDRAIYNGTIWQKIIENDINDATQITYDPTDNRIIVATSVNVDLALTDLDTLVAKKSGDTFTGDIIFSVEGDGIIGPGSKAVMRTSADDAGNAVVIGNTFGGLFLDSLSDITFRIEGKPDTVIAGQDYVDAGLAAKISKSSDTMSGVLTLESSLLCAFNTQQKWNITAGVGSWNRGIVFDHDINGTLGGMGGGGSIDVLDYMYMGTGTSPANNGIQVLPDGSATLTTQGNVDTSIAQRAFVETAIAEAIANKVNSTIEETGSARINNMVTIAQVDYDLLTPVANTLYIIVG